MEKLFAGGICLVLAEGVYNFVTHTVRGSCKDHKWSATWLWSLIFLLVWYLQLPNNKP